MQARRTSGRTLATLAALTLTAAGPLACDGGGNGGGSSSDGAATVEGRASDRSGNQSSSPGMQDGTEGGQATSVRGSASLVAVAEVNEDGSTDTVATGEIRSDGSFSVETPEIDGDFIVQARTEAAQQTEGEVVGQAMVDGPLEEGDAVTVMPISHETTAETEAYLELRGSGRDAEQIDEFALKSRISAEMATSVESGADLAGALEAAQKAYVETIGQVSGDAEPTARTYAEAKTSAWVQLRERIHAAGSAEEEAQAWAQFWSEATASLESSAGVDASLQATAEAAAREAMKAELMARGGGEATMEHARAHAAVVRARTSQEAQTRAATEADLQADLAGRLETAYDGFYEDVASAGSLQAVMDAEASLRQELSGWKSDDDQETVLEALIEAEIEGDAQARAEVAQALQAVADASAQLESDLEGATEASAIAEAYASFHATVRTELEAASELLSSAAMELTAGLTGSAEGSLSGVIDVTGDLQGGLELAGEILAQPGLQPGATGLVGGDATAGLESASQARLSRIESDGQLTTLAEGSADGSAGRFTIPDVEEMPEVGLVEVMDAEGELIGSALVHGTFDAGDQQVRSQPITPESSLEAETFLAAAAEAGSRAEVDLGLLHQLIDGATAAAAWTEGNVDAAIEAFLAAQACHENALDAEASALAQASAEAAAQLQSRLAESTEAAGSAHGEFRQSYHGNLEGLAEGGMEGRLLANAQAMAAWEATLDAIAGEGSETAAAADARAQMEAAMNAAAGMGEQVNSTIDGDARTELDMAAETALQATGEAASSADVEAAGSAFVEAVIGDATLGSEVDGLVEGHLDAEYQDAAPVRQAIEAALEARAQATQTLATDARSGCVDNVDAQGMIDADAAAQAVAQAFADFRGSAESQATGGALPAGVSEADAQLLLEAFVHVGAGLFAGQL